MSLMGPFRIANLPDKMHWGVLAGSSDEPIRSFPYKHEAETFATGAVCVWKAALDAVLVAHTNIFVRESAESRRMKRALEGLKAEAGD